MKKTWKHSWAAAIFGATAFVTTSTSQAEVIVYWEEVANGAQTDVVATWTGTLDVVVWSGPVSSVSSGVIAGDKALGRLTFGDSGLLHFGAVSSSPIVIPSTVVVSSAVASGPDSFGFSDIVFFYSSVDVNGSTSIDFDSTLHAITFPNTDLEAMNADGLSNTLAWTSSSGDTISYTTGSPSTVSAIPEPSSGLALGFLLLSGLMHRRRK